MKEIEIKVLHDSITLIFNRSVSWSVHRDFFIFPKSCKLEKDCKYNITISQVKIIKDDSGWVFPYAKYFDRAYSYTGARVSKAVVSRVSRVEKNRTPSFYPYATISGHSFSESSDSSDTTYYITST